MASNKEERVIIYFDRGSISFYRSNAPVVKVEFTADIVRDLEIKDRQKLNEQIKLFVESNKLPPSRALLVISPNVTFEKDLPETLKGKDDEVKRYVDSVPFESVAYEVFKQNKITRVFVVNRDLIESVRGAFGMQKIVVEAAVPASLIGEPIALDKGFTQETGNAFLKRYVNLKQYTLFGIQPAVKEDGTSNSTQDQAQSTKKRKIAYIAIFAIGISFLVGVLSYYFYFLPRMYSQKKTPVVTTITPSPTPVPTEVPSSTESAQLDRNSVTLQVLNGSGVAGQADLVKKLLNSFGYNNIETGNAQTQRARTTLVIFSKTLPQEIRTQILTEMEELFVDVSSQEATSPQFDIVIITGETSP